MNTSFYVRLFGLAPMVAFLALPLSAHALQYTQANLSSMAFYPKQTVSATVISQQHSQIRAQTSGEIAKIVADVGNTVKAGEVLAVLNCDDQTLAMTQIESSLPGTKARAEFLAWQLAQSKTLSAKQNVSQERLKNLETELQVQTSLLKQQENQLKSAKLQVSRCKIVAPFEGVITQRQAQLGDYAQPGAPMFKLLANQDVEVQAYIHPEMISLLPSSKQIVFKTDRHIYPVRIRAQVAGLDDKVHTQEVRLTFTKAKPLPGELGTLEWVDSRPHIPAKLLSRRNDQLGIFLNKEATATFVVIPQAREGSPAQLPSHLQGQIILEGRHQLIDGQSLTDTNTQGNQDEVA